MCTRALRAITADSTLPTGFKAYRDTVLTLAIFGSFINISSVIIVGDRLSRREPLTLYNAAVITRAFSTCVNWSPFFAGLAVVIAYSPTFSISTVILQGLPIAVVGVLIVLGIAALDREKLKTFRGFPIKWASLWIPALLAAVVLTLRYALPNAGLLPIISVSALLVVIGYLLIVDGVRGAVKTMHQHIVEDLPMSFNELTLLLAVGVLAAGLVSWVGLGDLSWRPPIFDGTAAVVLLASMLVVAMLGVHPVVTIALGASVLVPVNPDPELLATTFLLGWSLGTLACPLSGLHLLMLGRFGIPSWQGAMSHWPFVAIMFVLGSVWLQFLAWSNNI